MTVALLAPGLLLVGCGGGGEVTNPTSGSTPTDAAGTPGATVPSARQVVSDQNRQLAELEQRSSQDDPTVP